MSSMLIEWIIEAPNLAAALWLSADNFLKSSTEVFPTTFAFAAVDKKSEMDLTLTATESLSFLAKLTQA